MKPSLSCGPDGIAPAIVKTYGRIFVPVLTYIFNICLKTNVFSRTWKSLECVQFQRQAQRLTQQITGLCLSYRAVSHCQTIGLFLTALYKVFSSSTQNALIPNQHGFISGKSTTTNLAFFMEQASAEVSERGQWDVVYCDMSKAFDVVCHSLLRNKL